MVDAITGLGTMPLDIDGWGLDVVIGGSQKAFMIPPGLAFMSVSPKAWKLAETSTLPHFYFNLKKEKKSGDAGESSWTPATALILALGEALAVRQADRHGETHRERADAGARHARRRRANSGSSCSPPHRPAPRSPPIKAPAGLDSGVIVKEFRNRFGSIIANGQGTMKGQIFRIAHLGYFDFADLFAMIAGLEIILNANGHPVKYGTGVAAAQEVYAQAAVKQHEHPDRRAPRAGRDRVVSIPARLERNRFQSQGIRQAPGRGRRAVGAHRRAGGPSRSWRRRPSCASSGAPASAWTTSISTPPPQAGVLVMNTPGGNAISVAEHTLAMMLAMARHIPQANASTRAGKWEKKKFMGNELRGKTLGIVGLGSIGREVVKRARAFEMRIVAHDPYVTSAIAHDLGVELLDLPKLYAASDYITLHVAATPETQGMLSHEAFAQMKDGVRIVNCARGELVDEAALVGRPRQSAKWPTLRSMSSASSRRRRVSRSSRSMACSPRRTSAAPPKRRRRSSACASPSRWWNICKNGVAINAVNMPALSPEQYRALGPYATLAERLGNFAAHIATGNPHTIRLHYFGKIADGDTSLLRNAGLAGVLSRSTSHRANLINALQIAEQRGWERGGAPRQAQRPHRFHPHRSGDR